MTSGRPRVHRYEFSVRPGFHIKKDVAARVGRLIIELADRGTYSPQALVEAARDPKCPAHQDFEWNDARAAEEHRLNQARLYQRGIQYTIVVRGTRGGRARPIQMRVAYPIELDGGAGYASGAKVVQDKDLLRTLQERALAALDSWRTQYDMLRRIGPFVEIFQALDSVLGKKARGKRSPFRRRR